MNTTVYSLGKTSIRKVYQETRYSRSVMSPVHVIMHGDWTLYWRLTLKVKRKECYIFVSYRKVLPPIDYVAIMLCACVRACVRACVCDMNVIQEVYSQGFL